MNQLDQIKNDLIKTARLRDIDYTQLTKQELANKYCEAEDNNDELIKNATWAALLLKYWYNIYKWIQNSKSLNLEAIDFFDWLNDSLKDAFYYRSWFYEYQAVVRKGKFIEWKLDDKGHKIINEHYYKLDANAADRSINYFIAAKRGKEYQYSNKEKRKLNVKVSSLDTNLDENGDCVLDYYNLTEEIEVENAASILVKYFLSKNKQIEALIIDAIANFDSFKQIKEVNTYINSNEEETEYNNYSYEFNKRKVIKHLNSIDNDFIQSYFCKEYNISDLQGKGILKDLKKLNNIKLYKCLDNTLDQIRLNNKLKNIILEN